MITPNPGQRAANIAMLPPELQPYIVDTRYPSDDYIAQMNTVFGDPGATRVDSIDHFAPNAHIQTASYMGHLRNEAIKAGEDPALLQHIINLRMARRRLANDRGIKGTHYIFPSAFDNLPDDPDKEIQAGLVQRFISINERPKGLHQIQLCGPEAEELLPPNFGNLDLITLANASGDAADHLAYTEYHIPQPDGKPPIVEEDNWAPDSNQEYYYSRLLRAVGERALSVPETTKELKNQLKTIKKSLS